MVRDSRSRVYVNSIDKNLAWMNLLCVHKVANCLWSEKFMIKYISAEKSGTYSIWLSNVYMHVCTQSRPAYFIFICSMNANQAGLLFVGHAVCHNGSINANFFYLCDQGSWIKFIHIVRHQSSQKKIFPDDNSKCKVIKMPLTDFYLLENKLTRTKQKGNN